MISKSVVWHFSARGSHFRDEAKDNFNSRSQRQTNSEQANIKKFINKWGCLPEEDKETFVKPIIGTKVKTRNYFDINNDGKISWWEYSIPIFFILMMEILAELIVKYIL